MAIQVINNGSFLDDPTADEIFLSFEKTKANFSLLVSLLDAEVDSSGNLVFPYQYGQALAYNADGTVDTITATDGTTTWVMTFAYASGVTDTITVTDGTDIWIDTYTFNPDGTFNTSTGWILT